MDCAVGGLCELSPSTRARTWTRAKGERETPTPCEQTVTYKNQQRPRIVTATGWTCVTSTHVRRKLPQSGSNSKSKRVKISPMFLTLASTQQERSLLSLRCLLAGHECWFTSSVSRDPLSLVRDGDNNTSRDLSSSHFFDASLLIVVMRCDMLIMTGGAWRQLVSWRRSLIDFVTKRAQSMLESCSDQHRKEQLLKTTAPTPSWSQRRHRHLWNNPRRTAGQPARSCVERCVSFSLLFGSSSRKRWWNKRAKFVRGARSVTESATDSLSKQMCLHHKTSNNIQKIIKVQTTHPHEHETLLDDQNGRGTQTHANPNEQKKKSPVDYRNVLIFINERSKPFGLLGQSSNNFISNRLRKDGISWYRAWRCRSRCGFAMVASDTIDVFAHPTPNWQSEDESAVMDDGRWQTFVWTSTPVGCLFKKRRQDMRTLRT